MIKYNHNYAKPDADMRPLYGPMPLAYDIQHHEEWDEPVIDPETGEPTGETEHIERDWTEHKVAIHPSAADYAHADYLPLVDELPPDFETPDGQHYERSGEIIRDGDCYKWVYVLVPNPTPPPRRWSRLNIKGALADAHLKPAAQAYLSQILTKPDYPAWEALSDCNYIEEGFGGEEAWNALLNGAADALGKTREEIDAFLDAVPTEG